MDWIGVKLYKINFCSRSIVDQKNLTPLSAEEAILKRYYGKTKRFTEAVNILKKILFNIAKEAKPKSIPTVDKGEEKSDKKRSIAAIPAKTCAPPSQKCSKKFQQPQNKHLLNQSERPTLKIVLTRLKQCEIDQYTQQKQNESSQKEHLLHQSKRPAVKIETQSESSSKMTLRKRNRIKESEIIDQHTTKPQSESSPKKNLRKRNRVK